MDAKLDVTQRELQAGVIRSKITELDGTLPAARAKVNDAVAITAEKQEKRHKALATLERNQVAYSKAKEQLVDAN
ncbi:Aste57867_18328 [Aphanomyces stellatus]|uniref:Aste57867_16727 protein n=1 Tax=Aphanomyces stellatus TaxID=120398 RepID=A0A485LB89_9STRA|nr:hypothetical protein As57867_018266 [Aphanomyces stellatus]KAF0692167.1 hypothetical protein As57867_016670 [Aphanomyces stellatus]KAF0702029.1 hypothetical protein As57867_007801 [Aphanomyces stellatus]VFT84727.1 Aste57867_7831 [Aphanomyces stellatus]VFT93496.1 Aste57867_16727 [Aphanomyces stellatus]